MGSYKHAMVELDLAGLSLAKAAVFELKLNSVFGNWDSGVHGIYVKGELVLARSGYREFLKLPSGKAKKPIIPKSKVLPKVEIDVGVMTATVEAGSDGELGTEDDTVTITPRKKTKKKKASIKTVPIKRGGRKKKNG